MKPNTAPTFSPPDASLVQALKVALPNYSISTKFKNNHPEPQILVALSGSNSRNNGTHLLVAFSIRIVANDHAKVEETAYASYNALANIRSYPFSWVEPTSLPIYFDEESVANEQRFIPVQAMIASA